MVRTLLFLLLPLQAFCQFAYEVDATIPARINPSTPLPFAWAGGLNTVQINKMDLNGDTIEDLVLFDRTADKVLPYLARNNDYQYSPEYEYFFPSDLNNFLLLRDYNGDGRKDIFTGNPFGIKMYKNIEVESAPFGWEHYGFPTPGGGTSAVILSTGFSSKVNLQLQADDLPSIEDMDGDGDLDILVMNFSGTGQIQYHKNVSTQQSAPDFVRTTLAWGGLTECGCGVFAFTNTGCGSGSRVQHAGGKFLLALDVDANGAMDLLFAESSCSTIYLFKNEGTTESAIFTRAEVFPGTNTTQGLYPTAFLEDVDFDGIRDVLLSYGVVERSDEESDFSNSLQFFKNSGSNNLLQLGTNPANFLQHQMIDVGENAVPAFYDYDTDGDDDLFIGSFGKLRVSNNFSGSLYLFENKGTQAQPVFEWVTDDFGNLSSLDLYNIKPQFSDVFSDGHPDLVFTATDQGGETSLYYIINISSHGLQLDNAVQSTNVSILLNENIHLTEINDDGLLDILLGKSDGAVEYWQNRGTGSAPFWQLEEEAYIGLAPSLLMQNPVVYTAALTTNLKSDLILTDQHGTIKILPDFKAKRDFSSAEGELVYNQLAQQFENRNLGGRIWPVSYKHTPEKTSIFIGTMLGGIQVLSSLAGEARFEIYPNPLVNHQPLTIETLSSGKVQVYTTTGQSLLHYTISKGINHLTLPSMQAGVYLLRLSYPEKTITRRLIIY